MLNPSNYDVSSLAPVVRWPDRDHPAHTVQFYKEDTALLDSISQCITTALEAGDAAVVIATQAHRAGLEQRLLERGLDITDATRRGQYLAMDAAETLSRFMRDGSPDAVAFARVVGEVFARARRAASSADPSRIAAFGEMVALLWAEGNSQAALRLEELWNDLARTESFSLWCAYPITGFNRPEDSRAFLRICGAHSSVFPDESYTSLRTDGERLRKITHLQQTAQALETEKAEREQAERALGRKESELADLLENALEGAQQTGPDQRILWANRALLRLLGYAPEEYVGHSFGDFCTDPSVFDLFCRKLMGGQDVYDYPAALRCKDGSIRQILIHANGLWEDGEFVHARCFIRDVTAQKLAEQALRESEADLRLAKDKLESKVEQRTVALRKLSTRILTLQDAERRRIARELHDSLGQYLVGLKLNLELLKASPPDQDELWAQAMEIMEQCISEVRTLSCLLHPPTIDELGLASSAKWLVDSLSKRSGLQLSMNVLGDLPRLPAAIELVLFRALQEALTNVYRHSAASSAEVLIHQENEQVILEVKDNGCGVRSELLAHFEQTGAGMGVGLSGMRERVRELGGNMKMESDSGGTSLQVALPVTPECDLLAES